MLFAQRCLSSRCKTMAKASVTFHVLHEDQQARRGSLKHSRGSLETPALLLYTRRGSPLYLTPDMVEAFGEGGRNYLLDATKFLGSPSPDEIAKAPAQGRGLCALQDKFLVVTQRDSYVYNHMRWEQATNAHARVEGFAGSRPLKPHEYLEVAKLFQPDLLIPLSDEVPAEASNARHRTSVDRSLKWLDLALKETGGQGESVTAILAPIQGGTVIDARRYSAQECVRRKGVFGFALCGLATGELPNHFQECLKAALSELPRDGLRFAQGSLTPDLMLEAISEGVDLIDGTYVSEVTAAGFALDLQAPSEETASSSNTKINMLDTELKQSKSPLIPGCRCFTCSNHTQAYVHHLLVVHEMSAQILLEMHNVHQMLAWLGLIRKAIAQGTFFQFRQTFRSRVKNTS